MNRIKLLLATGFYSGYFPKAPGTAGTAVGLAIYAMEYMAFGHAALYINIALIILLIYPSIKIGDYGESYFGSKDPSHVVFDEMMGFWISMAAHSFNWYTVAAAFIIFRLMDIFKPFPAGALQKLPGGLGIMIDDYIAGVYTNILLWLAVFFKLW